MFRTIAAVALFMGCKSGDACELAWEHMQDVSKRELQALPAQFRDAASADKLAKLDAEAKPKFLARCAENKVDTACVMKSTTTFGYMGCMKK